MLQVALQVEEVEIAYVQHCTQNWADERVLTRGVYGTVYRGVDAEGPGTCLFAAKRLECQDKERREHMERVTQKEIENLTGFAHPNVARLLGFSKTKDAIVLLYQYGLYGSLHNNLEGPAVWFRPSEISCSSRAISGLGRNEEGGAGQGEVAPLENATSSSNSGNQASKQIHNPCRRVVWHTQNVETNGTKHNQGQYLGGWRISSHCVCVCVCVFARLVCGVFRDWSPEGHGQAQRLSWTGRTWIIHGVLEAISFLHEAGVFHRDVKPGSIVLAEPSNAQDCIITCCPRCCLER